MNCQNCFYCRDYDKRDDAGFCKRFPPVYVADEAGETMLTYPVVNSTDWCGEYRQKLSS